MAKIGEMIANITKMNDKAAPDITHALAVIGNGSMAEGLEKIVNVTKETAKAEGRRIGIIQGAGIVLSIWGAMSVEKALARKWRDTQKKRKALEAEEQAILSVMESTISKAKAENDEANKSEMPEDTPEEK